MSAVLLPLYHRLPAPARSAAAALRGLFLHSWRYGPESETLVAEALARERWSPAAWQSYQAERLARVLHRAATRVPYYREQWSARRRRGDRASWEEVRNWPVLDKAALRAYPAAFVADDCRPRAMFHERTSGTSGTPLELWWSRSTVRAWFGLHEARLRRWHGVSRHEPWVILGGQPVVPARVRRPPFWVWNAPMRQLYLSSNHLSARNAPAYAAAIAARGATHLVTYASSAAVLAQAFLEQGLHGTGLRVAITNAEPLFAWQRDVIGRGLGCAVRETYGMAEIVAAASECPAGTLHLWPEVGHLELLDDDADVAAPPGAGGRVVSTGLLNADMPLVRYAVGDRAQLAEPTPCACGRALPALARIEGRSSDLLLTADGRAVYWINPIFYGLPVVEAQVVQETLTRVRVRYVPGPGYTAADGRTIVARLCARFGQAEVMLEAVAQVPRGPNGKFRPVVCALTPEERASALAAGGRSSS
jgi:phenylacetate-CoA ligase